MAENTFFSPTERWIQLGTRWRLQMYPGHGASASGGVAERKMMGPVAVEIIYPLVMSK